MRFKLFALVAILATCAFSINANAQQADGINFTLSLYANTGYYAYDKDYAVKNSLNDGKANLDLVQYGLNPGSGLGATGKKGNVYADLSYNLALNSTSRLNMTWKPGNGFELLVGKAFGPYNNSNNMNLIYNWDLMAQFATFDSFPFQVRFTYMGVYLALLECAITLPTNVASATYETSNMTPKVAVGYVMGAGPADPFMVAVNGQIKTYKIVDEAGAASSVYDGKSVTAYKVNVDFAARKLAGMLDLLASAYYGTNFKQLGFTAASQLASNSTAYGVAGSIKNTVTMGGHAGVAVYIPGTIHKVAAGLGYESSKPDVDGAKKDEEMNYFVNFQFGLENNYYIVPTILIKDHKKDASGTKQGKESYYGIAYSAKV
jgi:hypothetical protein